MKDILLFDLNETLLDLAALDADHDSFRSALGALPAHADVKPELQRLKERGFRLVTLTNSTQKSATRLIEGAGLGGLFERVMSADAVRRYKPAREVYEYAANELGVGLGETRLVAAHGWDIAGALNAGCKAAFVARPGAARIPSGAQPDLEVADIRDLADRLAAK